MGQAAPHTLESVFMNNRGLLSIFALSAALIFLGGCAKHQQKLPQHMAFEELEQKISSALDEGDVLLGIRCLERILEEHPDNVNVGLYRLKLADLHFEMGKYNQDRDQISRAYDCYRRFYRLNPSDPRAEYASYRAILAQFHLTLRIECDPQAFIKTVKRCKKHLASERFARGRYAQDVRDIYYTCERSLIDREEYIFNVYLRGEKFKSAHNRIEYLRKHYGHHPDLESRLLYLECKLANAQGEKENCQAKAKMLEECFPDSPYTALANNVVHRPAHTKFLF